MKTIQEVLCELDTEKLLNTYFCEYPIEYTHYRGMNLTVDEIDERFKNIMLHYIERLKTMPIQECDDKSILYVHRCIKDGYPDQCYCLANMNEVLSSDFTETSYGYELSPQAEIMGFLVAETELTKRYLYELAASVLYEASFFGIEEEKKQDTIDSMERSINDIKSGNYHSYTWEELKNEMGFDDDLLDEESPDEMKLQQLAIKADNEYYRHSAVKELKMIRKMLLEEMK